MTCTDGPLLDAVDIGTILGWMSTTEDIPEGWALADGTNGTDDLRGPRRLTFTLQGGFAWSRRPYGDGGVYPIQKIA